VHVNVSHTKRARKKIRKHRWRQYNEIKKTQKRIDGERKTHTRDPIKI